MRWLVLGLVVLLLAPLAPASHAAATVSPYSVCPHAACAPGEEAKGLLAEPAALQPTTLVVIAHGYGHNAESHRGHLAHLAAQGYVAVAMDYRGTGFPLGAGAEDTIAATKDVLLRYPTVDRVVLYSVSMGNPVAGMVLAEMPGVFELWVVNEGLSMLPETWAAATAAAPAIAFAAQARDDVERECGGSPAVAPDCYLERSPALRAHEFVGLRGAVLTHGLNDGLVPYDQGREMVTALRATGVPSEFWTVARCPAGAEGTTLTGHATLGGRGVCGHGTESNDAHTMTSLSFRLLDEVLRGDLVPRDAEHLVDGELGTLP